MQIGGSDQRFLKRKTRLELPRKDPVRLVDLFSGCGGLTLGVAEACRDHGRGLEVVLTMELNDKVRHVYDANFTSTVMRQRGDVLTRFDGKLGAKRTHAERTTAKEAGDVEILVGGPPCQGHSNLNNHTRRNDPKNKLYLVMVRAAEILEPKCLLIENVPGVVKDSSGVLENAKKHLSGLGYFVSDGIVRLLDLGVPQLRVRHVLLASQTAQPSVSDAAERHRVRAERCLKWAIGDLRNIRVRGGLDESAVLSPENRDRARFLRDNGLYDLPNAKRPPCHREDPYHTYKSMYGRLKWLKPAHTITSGFGSPGQGRYLHPSQLRTLTPHEAARIQFFPDWFDFGQMVRYRRLLAECIGNAVPPKLAFAMACELLFELPEPMMSDGPGHSRSLIDAVASAEPIRSVA
jgi:DNA (cytosine-5)-methyltransferase 1